MMYLQNMHAAKIHSSDFNIHTFDTDQSTTALNAKDAIELRFSFNDLVKKKWMN